MKHINVLIFMVLSLTLLTACKAEETQYNGTITKAVNSLETDTITTDTKTGSIFPASRETGSFEAEEFEDDKEAISNAIVSTEPEAVESDSTITLAAPVYAVSQSLESEESTVAYKSDMLDIILYLYGPEDYDNPEEEKVISVSNELYSNNLAEALNYVFDETEIRINSAKVDLKTKCITVDLPKEVVGKFNASSCEGTLLTNELTDTILNLPDIESAIITVDGKKNTYADYYSFEGIFRKNKD